MTIDRREFLKLTALGGGAVFASALFTEKAADQKGRYGNVGAQVDLRFSVLHWYEMTLSVGAAAGLRGSERAGHEYMVSLKIL